MNVPTSTSSPAVTGTLVTATFSQAMNPATIISPALTFTLKETVAGTNVPGTVTMNAASTIATFTPTAAALTPNTSYTATVTIAAKNAGGTAMPNPISWRFTTSAALSTGQAPVNLGAAGTFAILAKTGISTTGVTLVTGNIGVSPGAASTITGFALTTPPTTFSTSAQVVGQVFASDYDPPTPSNMTTAVANMETAFTDAQGRPAGVGPNLNLLGGNLNIAQTLAPGVYTWGTAVTIAEDLTLSGSADDVWIFQITNTLDLAVNKKIILAGGAQAKNIFWQVSQTVNLLAGSHFEGIILSKTDIAIRSGASANSRLLAQTAVSLIGNAITQPAP